MQGCEEMEQVYNQVTLSMILLKSFGDSFSLQEHSISSRFVPSFYLNGEELQDLDASLAH
jgi:hypothetical protein